MNVCSLKSFVNCTIQYKYSYWKIKLYCAFNKYFIIKSGDFTILDNKNLPSSSVHHNFNMRRFFGNTFGWITWLKSSPRISSCRLFGNTFGFISWLYFLPNSNVCRASGKLFACISSLKYLLNNSFPIVFGIWVLKSEISTNIESITDWKKWVGLGNCRVSL